MMRFYFKIYADGKGPTYGYTPENRDIFGRPTGYSLMQNTQCIILNGCGTNASTHSTLSNFGYAYDPIGRFCGVGFNAESDGVDFDYSYLPGTDLVSGYTSGGFSRSVTYEPFRNLIAAVTNTFDSTLISAFDYANDAAGRRIFRCDTSDAAATTNTFGYNARSEVTSAIMGTNTYGYAYDPIGNRLSASHNAATNLYFANSLNQYTSISNLCASVPPHEGTNPVNPVNPVQESPVPPSAFAYDADGNMTADERGWRYVWNGENRLVVASNDTTVVTYAYDHRGRMVRKEISHGDTETRSIAYLWDDWNIIREIVREGGSVAVTDNVWGLDLNGIRQGLGGVGGLLTVARYNTSTPQLFFPTYDVNGNISEYVSTNGDIVAHYDYSPFGEPVSIGELATFFTHQFSTKPFCPVTGFSEYQMRKYRSYIGRWMSRDPAEEGGGLNIINLWICNLVSHIDYLGLWLDDLVGLIYLTPPATPWKCDCVAAAYSVWAPSTPINNQLWSHWLDGTGDELELAYSAFDPTYANRAAARWVVQLEVRGTREQAAQLECGQSKMVKNSFSWGAVSLPHAMIFRWTQRTDYVITYGKTCDRNNCCEEIWARADIDFEASDRVDFNPGEGIFLFPFYIQDDLVNKCFNINGRNDFDINAGDSAKVEEKWKCQTEK